MNEAHLKQLFPNASADFLAKNSGPVAVVESGAGDAPLGAKEVQGHDSRRFLVRVTSCRKRLIDQDNLCEKYHVDLLRYSGIITGDDPGTTQIEVAQVKAGKNETESTLIEVYKCR